MPCDAQYNISLDFQNTNFDLLVQSIKNLDSVKKKSIYIDKVSKIVEFTWKHGFVSIEHKKGKVTVEEGKEQSVNMIKRNYTREVIKYVGKKYGWLVKSKTRNTQQEQLKFALKKR